MHAANAEARQLDFHNDALFLDVDGTLLDIAATPDTVVVAQGLVANIARIAGALDGAFAMITGRTLDDLDNLFQPLRTRAAGVHGAQMRFDPEATCELFGAAPLPDRIGRRLQSIVAAFPLAFVENKGFAIAVHYRLNPRIGRHLRAALERFVDNERECDLHLLESRFAFEVKPRGFDKGLAIERFLARAPFRGRTPIFVGDDITDEDGFAVVAARHGLAYSVGPTRPRVAAEFPDAAGVRAWLDGAARSLGRAP